MKKQSLIDGIYNDGLCLGCGLCESVCGKDSVEMQLQNDGFFKPVIKSAVKKENEDVIQKICPGVNIVNDLKFDDNQRVWGKIERLYSAHSTDNEVRTKGSSGGIVSAISIYLLETGQVDAVLQVGGNSDDYERNALRISRNKQDVLSCASSRYAPALIFDHIFEILQNSNDKFCFVGKPCDISGLKNFLVEFPQFKDRFKLTISIICAGLPSFKATEAIVNDFKPVFPIRDLLYRGNGWPGYFSFLDKEDKRYQLSYNDSWGKRLGKQVHIRCKICPDGIGLQADIAVGDAWETEDGYPDFSEREGSSLVIVRTNAGIEAMSSAQLDGRINYSDLEERKIAIMQPFQYKRRTKVGIRALAFGVARRRMLNYKDVGIINNTRRLPVMVMAREFWGMFKRAIK